MSATIGKLYKVKLNSKLYALFILLRQLLLSWCSILFLDCKMLNGFLARFLNINFYTSCLVFLFSAIALYVPSGYSYAPAVMFLMGCCLLYKCKNSHFQRHDYYFLGAIFAYFVINACSIFWHSLPSQKYDLPSRYLAAIPVYLLLVAYPPRQKYFWWGIAVGSVGAGSIALQQYLLFVPTLFEGRSNGYIHPIQFGGICVLFFGLLIIRATLCLHDKNIVLSSIFLVASGIAMLSSILSFSRGGWLAIPLIAFVLYKISALSHRKGIVVFGSTALLIALFVYWLLPNSNSFKNRILTTEYELKILVRGDNEYSAVRGRVLMWQNGIEAFKARPIFGWGDLSNIKSHFSSNWTLLNHKDTFTHLHNEYIDALAKTGLLGFAALMAMYLIPLSYFIGLMCTRQADVMPFAAAGVVLILCVMIFGLTQCFLAHNSGTMVFVFYLVIIKAYCRNIVAARSSSDIDFDREC